MYYREYHRVPFWRLFYFFLYSYINDLPIALLNLNLECSYADDTLIYNTIHNIDDCLQLQRDLAELEKWTKI